MRVHNARRSYDALRHSPFMLALANLLSFSTCQLTCFEIKSMSQVQNTPSTSSLSNFQSIFNAAVDRYETKTKSKLLIHPLAAQLQSCDSPAAVLSLLQGLVQQFDQGRSSDERFRSWLNPTVNVLFAFSATLGEGVGLVNLY